MGYPYHDMQHQEPQVKVVSGSFAPAGTSAPTTVRGKGFTVARTGVGQFTITLDKRYPELLDFQATLQLATATDQFCVAGAVDLSAKTAIITVWDVSGTGAADVAANANNRVNFSLTFKDTRSV